MCMLCNHKDPNFVLVAIDKTVSMIYGDLLRARVHMIAVGINR